MKNIFTIDNLDGDRCFLCGEQLTDANRSDEHVFPVWLQHRVGLWDQSLALLNGTKIPYRQLKIPCCADCNNGCLSALANEIGEAFDQGYDAVRSLPPIRLFQWCGKLWYGLLFKELSLLVDRRDASLGTIMGKEGLEDLQTHHIFLQSIRLPMHFEGFEPASVFIMKTHRYDDVLDNFDYIDNLFIADGEDWIKAPFIAIRCEGVAVACVLEDLGMTQKHFAGKLNFDEGQTLHPLQFVEVASALAYLHSIRLFSTRYTTARLGASDEYRTTVDVWPTKLWGQQDVEQFKKLFKKHVSRLLNPGDIFDKPGLAPSFLIKDGKRIVMDKDGRTDEGQLAAKPTETLDED